MDERAYDWRADRHTYVQRETIIPRHYCVAGYKNDNLGLALTIFNGKVFFYIELYKKNFKKSSSETRRPRPLIFGL